MSGCQSCNGGCQSQNTCQWCNTCQSCDTNCNGPSCNTIQAFCSIGGQSVGGFSFGQCLKQDELFFTKTNWNKIFTYINNAYAHGNANVSNNAQSGSGVKSGSTGGNSGLPSSDSNDFMTAEMFNKVSTALAGLGSSYSVRKVEANKDIIYGSYFSELENYANALQYTTSQCNNCNANCNTKCNTCLKCNVSNCGRCNGSCQAHSPSNCVSTSSSTT